MLVAVNVALRAGPDITAAASADPFAGEVFWTGGNRAYVRRGGVDVELAPRWAEGRVHHRRPSPRQLLVAADQQTHAALLEMISDQISSDDPTRGSGRI